MFQSKYSGEIVRACTLARARRTASMSVLLLLCVGSALWGQAGPAEIEGIVIDAASDSPLRKAYVTLSTVEDSPAEALAITDDSGRFGFANIPPGRYKLHASCDGYQQAWFGAPTPHHAAGVITLHAGESRQDFALRLSMLSTISGVVLDQDGDPVDGAMVSFWTSWFRRGKPGFRQHGSVSTNDRGEYRMSSLTPGSYLVMVNCRSRQTLRMHPESVASAQRIEQFTQFQFGVQYFPSAERPTEASLVTIAAVKEIAGIDFHLTARETTTLHGTVVPPPDLPADAFIQIATESLDMPNQAGFVFNSGAGPPNHEFNISPILPGEYLLVASVSAGARPYRGVQRVVVAADGENRATIKLDPGIDLAGTLKVEGQKAEPGTRVLLPSGDGFPSFQGQPQAQVKADGTFVIQGVVPGIWDIDVQPIPDGGYVKSMRLGRQDVLTEVMVIASDTKDKLDIVVSTHGGILEGDVKTESGESAGPVHVLAAPDGAYSNVLSFYSVANSDEKGHFRLKHLTPGRYRIFAFDVLDYCAWCDPDFLKPFAGQGQPVQIVEGLNQSKEVRLIHHVGKQP
jgi:protocatechuate 3,4-dioxygenase beta subunit